MNSHQIGMKALKRLKLVIKDFPFASDIDRTVALAAMVLAVQRPTLPTAPIIAFTATTPASGKTLLMTGIASLTNGLSPAVHGFKPNEEEFSKVLMSVLMQSEPYLLIDNVRLGVALESDCLCAVVSSANWGERVLGASKYIKVSTRLLIFVSGNNLRIGSDLTRRTLMCHLDAKMERPELREFERNFLEICLTDRNAIISDVLTILSAYHAAGRPVVNNVRLGSFETFCDDICKPLVWLGEPDPVLGLAKADADASFSSLGELLLIWQANLGSYPVTTSELMANPVIASFFYSEFDDRNGVTTKRVGSWISKFHGRVMDGCRIVKSGTRQRAQVWQLDYV